MLNNNKNSKDINGLLDKILSNKIKKIKNLENFKQSIVVRVDKEINRLYAKKNVLQEMWAKQDILRLQRIGVWRKIIKNTWLMNLRYLVSMPFIYGFLLPTFFMHICLEIYHQVCFRLYNIPLVRARDYFIFDRRHLPYLNWLEKINCWYCSYFNCLIAYAREIAGRTERYWCPIKHARRIKDQHSNYNKFIDYADDKILREKWAKLRKFE